jgi:hypothetical protein
VTDKKLGFMALLTLGNLAVVQAASLWGLVSERLPFDTYMTTWAPMLTLMVGFWFGQQRGVE